MYFKNVYSILRTKRGKSSYRALVEEYSTRKILRLALAARVCVKQFSLVGLKKKKKKRPFS